MNKKVCASVVESVGIDSVESKDEQHCMPSKGPASFVGMNPKEKQQVTFEPLSEPRLQSNGMVAEEGLRAPSVIREVCVKNTRPSERIKGILSEGTKGGPSEGLKGNPSEGSRSCYESRGDPCELVRKKERGDMSVVGVSPMLPVKSGNTRPVFLELCAGSARLSAAVAAEGMTAIAIDHFSNRHTARHRIMVLDLSVTDSWAVLYHICESHPVIWVHVAPPCGTAARARDVPMSAEAYGPRPLRSSQHPCGLT